MIHGSCDQRGRRRDASGPGTRTGHDDRRRSRPRAKDRFGLRGFALALVVIALGGCSSSTLQLYVRPNGAPPALTGRTVAVLPPIIFGGDPVNAVVFDRAQARVFQDELGAVRFVGSESVRVQVASVPGATEALRAWSTAAEQRRFFPAEGDARVLHDGKRPLAGGVELDQEVRFRTGGGASGNLLPSRIEPAWFGALEADYLLASMSYTKYRQESGIYALFGILPFAGYSYGGPADVRAHYAVYDRRSGIRLWEAFFGVVTRETSPGKWPEYPLDPRTGTVLGAAWTLAQEIEEAFLRLLSDDPRRSDSVLD